MKIVGDFVKPQIDFLLPNARVGKTYTGELKIIKRDANLPEFIVTALEAPPELGLTPSDDHLTLSGSPAKDGEFKVKVRYQFAAPEYEQEITLLVNPDPQSLWKDIPSDQTDLYAKPDIAPPQLCPGTGRTLVAASRRGRSHAHVGAFRDDDYALHADPNSGWHVLAVADGAGSAQYSRKGSQLAVQTSVRFVAEQLATRQGGDLERAVEAHHTSSIRDRVYDVLGGAAHASVKAIQAEAKRINRPVKDFSTTLLLAAHKKMAAGEFVAAYWVGDGGVGVYKRGEFVKLLGDGDSGEFAGQTRFLDHAVMTSEEIARRLRFTLVDDFTSLILMTDGVSDPKFETDNNLRSIAYWDSLWSEIESGLRAESTGSPPEEFLLTWLDFLEAGNHDDRTIAVLF